MEIYSFWKSGFTIFFVRYSDLRIRLNSISSTFSLSQTYKFSPPQAQMAYIEAEIMGVDAWWIGLTDQGHEGRSVEILW